MFANLVTWTIVKVGDVVWCLWGGCDLRYCGVVAITVWRGGALAASDILFPGGGSF